MSFRLYESAWVYVEGDPNPNQVHKDAANLGVFNVGGHQYDIDARPLPRATGTPTILSILSLQDARAAGLSSHYSGDIERKTIPDRK
jgi:hypothetical protein